MLFSACGDATEDAADGHAGGAEHLLVVANASLDFQTGSYAAIDIDTLVAQPDVGALHGDSVIRATRGYLFAINRLGADNLQRIDPETLATVWQYSVGAGANPQDIVVLPDGRAYVARYDQTDLWIVDPDAQSDAEFQLGAIDLAEFADADGLPEVVGLAELGGRVYAALQRLDRDASFTPANDSMLVAIDPLTDALVDLSPGDASTDARVLPTANPVAMQVVGDELWLACAGNFGQADGALERYDPTSGAFLEPVVSEAQLEGDLAAFTATRPTVVVWSDASFVGHAAAIAVEGADRGNEVARLVDGLAFIQDIEADDTFVYLPDRDREQPGVRIFRRADWTEVTAEPIGTGLPPWQLEVVGR